jgi:ubiquinone/menaquinone biosynthesis C-methylase UbiE
MKDYYEDRLSGDGLQKCYELAPPRIRRYLDAELRFVAERLRGSRSLLELGCGYGRAMKRVSLLVPWIVGCDTSRRSLQLATSYMAPRHNFSLVRADASQLAFRDGVFDAVFCIQNGISAFGVDRGRLVAEAVRVTRSGGSILFSSYSPRIWEERLDWFREQARAGLIGEIDEARTGDGTIVCTDGFRATTVGAAEFVGLYTQLGLRPTVREVDGSSVFAVASK